MTDLTQTQIQDLLAKQLTQQWLSQERLIDQHTQQPNKDQLVRGLRILQLDHRLGTRLKDGELYYYLRTEFQAACARALPIVAKKAAKLVGKELTMGDVMQLALRYETEIQKTWESSTHRPHAFATLLGLAREGVRFSLVDLPGPEQACTQVKQVECARERQTEEAQKSWVLTRENGWNEPLVGVAVACA